MNARRLPAIRTDDAIRDLDGHAEYIAQDQPAAAIRLIQQFEMTVDQLQRTPHLGRPIRSRKRRLRGIRMIMVFKFRNFTIFYRINPGSVEVLRLLHGAQDFEAILVSDQP